MSTPLPTTVSSQGFEYGVKHFLAPFTGPAIDIIQDVLNLSSGDFLELFKLGSIYINNQRLKDFNLSTSAGSAFRVHTKPRRYFCDYDWDSRVVFENSDFLILNKPAGLPSHPSVDNQIENSLTQSELYFNKKLLISHRLDTTTEGLIVYGKTKEFVKNFNKQIEHHHIQKNYVALCETDIELPKHVIHYMQPSPRAPKKVVPHFTEGVTDDWDFCELKILAQKKIDVNLSWVKIDLLTGRTHQIRAQMSELGAPLCGDPLYGAKLPWAKNKNATTSVPIPEIALRSQMIEFSYAMQTHRFELSEEF